MILRLVGILVATLSFQPSVFADSWFFEKKSTDYVYEFGKTKIIRTVDATRNQQYPEYALQIFLNNELMALYRNISFEHVFSAKDEVFIGFSNSGLPGTAIIIFDKNGNLKLEIKHHYGNINYCEESITMIRKWYDASIPNVKIDYDNEKISQFTFNDCNGKRASLSTVIKNAYNKVN